MFDRLPLKDIHLPDAVSWWPPAPGWWLAPIVLALSCLILLGAAKRLRRHVLRRRLRRQAMAELDRIARRYAENGDSRQTAETLSLLLRRVAVTVFPGPRVAGLTGAEWVQWLLDTGPRELTPAAASALADAPYRPAPAASAPALLAAARQWIRHVIRTMEPSP